MILVADSGSTKTDWCLIKPSEEDIYFTTEGYNPYFAGRQYIIDSIKRGLPETIEAEKIQQVYFYGAGCQEDKVEVMREILQTVFPDCTGVSVDVDLLAAARGLLKNKPGFAAILGTGTNTCLYDGKEIVHNIDSLGYILGDEGSGAAIGKKILGDYLRNKMPDAVSLAFKRTYKLSAAEIINKIYGEPLANRFCASFTVFLTQPEIDQSYSRKLVRSSFREFFQQLVSCYPEYTEYTFNSVGSVAYYFKDILLEVLQEFNMKPGIIIRSLIQELANYHKGLSSARKV